MMMGRCRKDVYTCLRFANHRSAGWEISKSRAKQIIKLANQKGLMQNAEISLGPDGAISGAICNCCADCCYPHLLAEKLDVGGLWPLTRYVAKHLETRCTSCGRCVKRCPFDAFKFRDASTAPQPDPNSRKKAKRTVVFDSRLCRGCGVCSTGCPENAIEMIRLEQVASAWQSRVGQR
jgi:ferredoxin